MAEKSQVFDIFHPTPISLKELAVMAVSLEIWRCQINKHRTNHTLNRFWPSEECISSKTIFPDSPPMITDVIQEYMTRFADSLVTWLKISSVKVFYNNDNYVSYILKKFDDFACDNDGTVHYEKTAKRMMDSDRLNQSVKFKIACLYFFEDDIRRLWPSVCEKVNLNNINFERRPELYYWICCLRDELEKIPVKDDVSVDETMLYRCMSDKASSKHSVQYFWDRIPLESRMQTAVKCFQKYYQYYHTESFVRFILPKLDEDQLTEFVNENGVKMVLLLLESDCDETFVLSTWTYIRNIMNVSQITDLVVKMLQSEVDGLVDRYSSSRKLESWLYLCFEILDNLPLDLKLSIIRSILSNNTLVESLSTNFWVRWRTAEFLLGILMRVTFRERNVFFHKYWHLLIPHMQCKDLKRLVAICFENEDEISQFKENIMIGNRIVGDICVLLLMDCFFDELNEFVSFCYPDTAEARVFKEKLLQLTLLGEDPLLTLNIINSPKKLNEFIDDVYQNADLSADFKNQLMSSSSFQHRLSVMICSGELFRMNPIQFLETFVSSEQTMQQIKTRMVDAVKEKYSDILHSSMDYLFFPRFLKWCLGSQEEYTKFQLFCNAKFERM